MNRLKLFFWVIFFQILILNNIQFSGYINPYYYIIFILTIPNHQSKVRVLLLSFILGFIIDIFSNSYGSHAFSCVLIAYLKTVWINNKVVSDGEDAINFNNLSFGEFIKKSSIYILIHHFSLFFLERFYLKEIIPIILITFVSSIFTLILLIIHKALIPKKS